MARICGPIAGFGGEHDGAWRLAILFVFEAGSAPGPLDFGERGQPSRSQVEPVPLGEVGGAAFFRYVVSVARTDAEQVLRYGIEGDAGRWEVSVPGRGQPPRIAYASCNGFSMPGAMKTIAEKNALWEQIARRQAEAPFHLLLMGGDQIYADRVWDVIPALRRFNEAPRSQRITMQPEPNLRQDLERFYVETYRQRFTPSGVAAALASTPSIMMWDDHDIFDGWGSYSDEEQASPVFRTVFAAARTCFALFQLQSDPAAAPAPPVLPDQGGFNALFRLGDLGVLVLDLRSERSRRQILAPPTWERVFAALDGAHGLRHLLVMSSIPVVHPDLSFIERALEILPGNQGIEDDLHDQWVSYNHRTERLRLIHRLLDFADAQGTRVTIVSGDVHVAALGVVESVRRPVRWLNANVINQLTSSAVVHPPPPSVVRHFLERMGDETAEIDRGISAKMLQFPGTSYRFVAARNWLSLEPDDSGRIWANWHVEDQPQALTKTIHPCEPMA
jgi:hypothetical protein